MLADRFDLARVSYAFRGLECPLFVMSKQALSAFWTFPGISSAASAFSRDAVTSLARKQNVLETLFTNSSKREQTTPSITSNFSDGIPTFQHRWVSQLRPTRSSLQNAHCNALTEYTGVRPSQFKAENSGISTYRPDKGLAAYGIINKAKPEDRLERPPAAFEAVQKVGTSKDKKPKPKINSSSFSLLQL